FMANENKVFVPKNVCPLQNGFAALVSNKLTVSHTTKPSQNEVWKKGQKIGADKETAQGITITNAAKAARVAHLIYSSVASANRGTGIQHFDGKYGVEKHVQASGAPYTIVAPVFFMENLLQPWTLSGLRQGKLGMALAASRSLQPISVGD